MSVWYRYTESAMGGAGQNLRTMELSDRILNFLGKPDTAPDFQAFLNETKYECFKDQGYTGYHFDRLGLMVHCHDGQNISSVSFHIQTCAVKDGAFEPYTGLLPFGITTADSREQVSSKLGVQPFRSTPDVGDPGKEADEWEEYSTWWDTYNLPPLRFTFVFRSAVDGMDMLGVNFHSSPTDMK